METKHWVAVFAILATIAGVVFYGIPKINANSAIAKCEQAGYDTPEKSLNITSCPADEDYAHDSVALVVGNVAGSPAPVLTDETGKYLRNSLAANDNKLDIYAYSAAPGGQRINLANKKVKKSGSVSSFIRNATAKVDSVNKAIDQAPGQDGADYLNNIVTAARAVKTSADAESPLVLVIGSGLSDAQPLNFAASDVLHAKPQDVLDDLKTEGGIQSDDLAGVTVVWSGLGVTAPPQQPLDATEKRNITEIYRTIIEYMGGTFVADDTVMASDSVETNYTVGEVKVNGLKGGLLVFRLGEKTIGFKPDSADITDTSKAKAALGGVVSNYQQCTTAKVEIDGYEALLKGEKATDSSEFSLKRAETVKQLLVGLGVPSAQITANGRGSGNFDGRVSEINTAGDWDDARAQANRIVLIKMTGVCK